MSSIETIQLDCGMPLVVEPIDNVASVAISWVLPAGSSTDSRESDGYAAILSELILRGAAGKSSREFSDALDRLGVSRSTDAQTHHLRIDATMVGDRLSDALPLIVDIVRDPILPEDALDPVRSLCLQELASLDDDPQHLTMLRLRERHLPPPFNRHGYGDPNVLSSTTIGQLRNAWKNRAKPDGSIIGIAGAVDPRSVANQLNQLLDGWAGATTLPTEISSAERGYLPVTQQTAQVHIGLAFDAPPERDEESMTERLAIGVLSGSTSGRLFTEVRQKRSLCYSVGASYRADRDRGVVSLYAGTTPERAQQTLDVCQQEINRLKDGVDQAEFNRAVIGLKSRQIMQGESTMARAGALVYDHFRLARARTLEEVAAAIDAVTLDHLNSYVESRDFGEFTVVSIGPEALKVPDPRQLVC